MRTRAVVLVAGLAASLLAIACESSSSGGGAPFDVPGSGGFDAGGSTDSSAPNEPLVEAGTADANGVDSAVVDASDAGTDGGGSLQITSTVKAAATVDLTGQEFGAPTPDGTQDATIDVVIVGAFDAIIWVSTDAAGVASADSHQWDTLVDAEPLPVLGQPFTVGNQTWTVGVADGATLLNDAQGHVSVAGGTHNLTISCESTFRMVAGQNFRIYARQGATWVAGPVFTW